MYVLYVGLTNLEYKLRLCFVVFFYLRLAVSNLQNPHFYGIMFTIERKTSGSLEKRLERKIQCKI